MVSEDQGFFGSWLNFSDDLGFLDVGLSFSGPKVLDFGSCFKRTKGSGSWLMFSKPRIFGLWLMFLED